MNPRLLTTADVPQCLELSAEAGWNQTSRDWIRLMTLAPESCFGIEVDGRLAASATLVCYGDTLAWIGMVLVRKSHRGRGYARTLLGQSLDVAAARQIACVKLDATDLGEPVYRKLGFEAETGVERWQRDPLPGPPPDTMPPEEGKLDLALDREVFGVDRSTLLWLLELEGCLALPDGSFGMIRPGAQATFAGPCVTREPHAGRALLEELLSDHTADKVYWDRFSRNAATEPDLGFQRVRSLLRMYKGKPPECDPQRQFALAGFELG